MIIVARTTLIGTKISHNRMVQIELGQDGERWCVTIRYEFALEHSRIIYDGQEYLASDAYINAFLTHLADDYRIDARDPMTQTGIFYLFHRTVESIYMKVLASLGYQVNGRWEMRSIFTAPNDGKELQDVSLHMHKIPEGGKTPCR